MSVRKYSVSVSYTHLLDEDKQEEILSHIEDIEQAGDIVDLLKYDEDTAGGLDVYKRQAFIISR